MTRTCQTIGIDLGTSGCRAVAVNQAGETLADARTALPEPSTPAPGWAEQDPRSWWSALMEVLGKVCAELPPDVPTSIAVDATSATLLLADTAGRPLTPALMYNDRRAIAAAESIAALAPADNPARGASSSLAKLIHLERGLDRGIEVALALHQADWIAGRLGGHFGFSDWNNALKLGYDTQGLRWPDWVTRLVPPRIRLPKIHPPGDAVCTLAPGFARDLDLPSSTRIMAGTTDSTAAAIAAGAVRPGDAVTCLGSTLVLKIVSEQPIWSSPHGVYSHRLGEHWLVGGASNSGGAVLRGFFTDSEIATLSPGIDPDRPSGLDYYPLPSVGERFPRNDPGLAPRITPIPDDRRLLLQGIFEGIAAIESEGYRLLHALGAPFPRRVVTIGGGAANPVWTGIRERMLGIPVTAARHQEAAYGAAMLASGRFQGHRPLQGD